MSPPYSYPKHEKLKSRKRIAQLFTDGHVVKAFPIRIHYMLSPIEVSESNIEVGVSVSKRNFKKAPDRNTIKRLLREAYRLQQHDIKNAILNDDKVLSMMIIYGGSEILTQNEISTKLKKAFSLLVKSLVNE